MKMPIHIRRIMLLAAATLSLTFPLHAQQSTPPVGPRPPKAGDEKIVKSPYRGYLRVFTPEREVYIPLAEIFVWENSNYRVRPESNGKTQTGFHRRPLALDPGIYVVEIREDNYNADIRVSIKPGRITSVWLNDSDRPKFNNPVRPILVRDAYGDVIGYRGS
ncbi:MAG TPA: hypothetical protein VIT23_16870 [Terrimicrobiaceae bacterium]